MRNIEVLSLPVSHPPAIQWMMSITLRYGRLLTLACARPSALGCYTRRHEETCQHFVPSTTSWRGAKKKASVRLKELAQGRLEGNELRVPLANDSPQYPAVIQGAKTNMLKYKNCVLLTRVGSFYELYFDQAEQFGPLLNLKVACKKTSAGVVPMAGFPFYQLDRFLRILVQDLQKHVAISEEFANVSTTNEKSSGLMFDRRVARVVTPGTLIDEKFLDHSKNNFLLAVYFKKFSEKNTERNDVNKTNSHSRSSGPDFSGGVGLSWLDLSTGDFYTQRISRPLLPSVITKIGAKEILLDKRLDPLLIDEIKNVVGQDHHLLTNFTCELDVKSMSDWSESFESPISSELAAQFSEEETTACHILLEYVRIQMQGVGIKLQAPRRKHLEDAMIIDRNSLKGLEILETSRDGLGKGSLLHSVRRTSTKSGARLLRDRLTSPSASLAVINERLDLVATFLEDPELEGTVVSLLKQSYDTQRLVQKFSLGRGDADDLLCLSKAIEASRRIRLVLSEKVEANCSTDTPVSSQNMLANLFIMINRLNMHGPEALSKRILQTIDEEAVLQKQRIEEGDAADAAGLAHKVILNEGSPEDFENMPQKIRLQKTSDLKDVQESEADEVNNWIMRHEASPVLKQLHESLEFLYKEKSELTQKLREETKTASLSLKWTPGLGHIVHMKGSKAIERSLDALGVARTVSSSKSTRSFHLPSWSRLGAQIDEAKLQIRYEEQRIFKGLRQEIILNLVKLRRNAAVLDELDVACSFASLAREQRMTRPILNTGSSHRIVGGRHPTVKLGLEEQGRRFISNDCFVGEKERIWLITGPNMAGKSTFLRQNALITILAQVGSFVPAEFAEIGIVDQIFSRIGAADDLFRDQSTFMVEMLETAAILKHASRRSFVIMDEVGRGTAPEDGIAIGFACLHHLHFVTKCRTLFATHFHSLADMTTTFEHLGRYCTNVTEDSDGSFAFMHKLTPGVNRDSHALKVARIAGIPQSVIDIAKSARDGLYQSTLSPRLKPGKEVNLRQIKK